MAGMFSLGLSTGAARKPNRFYLAYGSNLSLERMKSRCPDAVVLGTAVIPGYRLLFKKSKTGSYATIGRMPTAVSPHWSIRFQNWMKRCLTAVRVIPGIIISGISGFLSRGWIPAGG